MTAIVAKDQYNPGQELSVPDQETSQYTLSQILSIWLAAGTPMWLLGWVAYPVLSASLSPVEAGLLRIKLMTVGLIWQFVLALIILYTEEGNIRLSTIRRRFWLNNPVSPRTGQKDNRLWWLLVPLLLLTVALATYSQLVLKWQMNEIGTLPVDLGGKAVAVLQALARPWVLTALVATFLSGLC